MQYSSHAQERNINNITININIIMVSCRQLNNVIF